MNNNIILNIFFMIGLYLCETETPILNDIKDTINDARSHITEETIHKAVNEAAGVVSSFKLSYIKDKINNCINIVYNYPKFQVSMYMKIKETIDFSLVNSFYENVSIYCNTIPGIMCAIIVLINIAMYLQGFRMKKLFIESVAISAALEFYNQTFKSNSEEEVAEELISRFPESFSEFWASFNYKTELLIVICIISIVEIAYKYFFYAFYIFTAFAVRQFLVSIFGIKQNVYIIGATIIATVIIVIIFFKVISIIADLIFAIVTSCASSAIIIGILSQSYESLAGFDLNNLSIRNIFTILVAACIGTAFQLSTRRYKK